MEKKNIGICLKAQNNNFWWDMKKFFFECVRERTDIQCIVRMPGSIYESQESILTEFIDHDVDGIIWAPSNYHDLRLMEKIRQQNIPLVLIDSDVVGCVDQFTSTVFFDNYDIGVQTGKLFLRIFPHHDIQVAIIAGLQEGNYTAREHGFLDTIEGKLSCVRVYYADFQEDKAYLSTKQLLTEFIHIQGIFCTSDNMAFGCRSCLQEHGRDDVKVAGCDATEIGRRAVECSELLSTVDTHFDDLSRCAIQTIMSTIQTGKIMHITLPVSLITQVNATQCPKQVIQKRKYLVYDTSQDLGEFNYTSLPVSHICPILIGDDIEGELPVRLATLQADIYFIITDDIVSTLYGNGLLEACLKQSLQTRLFSFPHGEKNKNFTTLNNLLCKILDCGITKKSVIVALGGGVVGNIAGLLANILMRGVRFVQAPTTVMHQADASTGGKQAVNTHHGKNLLGSFYEPEFIYNDITCINTLPQRDYNNGIAEIIKHGLCDCPRLIEMLDSHVSYRDLLREVILHKISIMEQDPREINKGFMLIYGHTVGHALEILSEGRLLHGEAIALGMVVEATISFYLGCCSKHLISYHKELFCKYNLPVTIPEYINENDIIDKLSYDKKERKQHMRFPLLKDIGEMVCNADNYTHEVPMSIIRKAIVANMKI